MFLVTDPIEGLEVEENEVVWDVSDIPNPVINVSQYVSNVSDIKVLGIGDRYFMIIDKEGVVTPPAA